MAGAIQCLACKPQDYMQWIVADAVPGKTGLWWRDFDQEFDSWPGGEPEGGTRAVTSAAPVDAWAVEPVAEGGGGGPGAGAGSGAAAVEAFESRLGERIDPVRSATAPVLLVSTTLEACWAAPSRFWEVDWDQDVSSVGWLPVGLWRRLNQRYFAWLVRRVDRLAGEVRREADTALAEIAVAAFDAGVFGEWVLDDRWWPRVPPAGYEGPRRAADGWNWEWEWDERLIWRSAAMIAAEPVARREQGDGDDGDSGNGRDRGNSGSGTGSGGMPGGHGDSGGHGSRLIDDSAERARHERDRSSLTAIGI